MSSLPVTEEKVRSASNMYTIDMSLGALLHILALRYYPRASPWRPFLSYESFEPVLVVNTYLRLR